MSSGHEALQLIKAGGIDLVIGDLRMPDINGWELQRAIAELDPGRSTGIRCVEQGAVSG